MNVSKTCEYAIRAMIFIAQKSRTGEKISAKNIAAGIDAPVYFTGKILQDLGNKGIVQSSKGPTGGFWLDEKSWHGSLADVILATDGADFFTKCGLGLKQCSQSHPCPIHDSYKKIRTDMHRVLSNARFETFVKKLDTNQTFLKSK